MTSSRKRDDLMQDVEPESGRDSERFHAEVRRGEAVCFVCADKRDAARPIGSSASADKHLIRRQRGGQKVGLLTAELLKVRPPRFSVITD